MNSKKYFFSAVVLFLLFTASAFAQMKIDDGFFNNWVLDKCYEKLHSGIINMADIRDSVFYRHFYFYKNDSLVMWTSFNEGMTVYYKKINSREVLLDSSGSDHPVTLKLIEEKGKNVLVMIWGKESFRFISLPEKYNYMYGINDYAADLYFTGKYYVNGDKKRIVEFTTDGHLKGFTKDLFEEKKLFVSYIDSVTLNLESGSKELTGIDDLDKYRFFFFWYEYPLIDNLIICEKRRIHVTFHFERKGNDLILYNVEGKYPETPVTSLFLTLNKL